MDIFDAHTHLGTDIDGMVGRPRGARSAILDRYGISRAFVFCLDEPDRHPAFRARQRPDARVRGRVGRAPHPVRPARPEREPIEEAERCLDRGARGIKLHPRAQKFALNDERLAPVFAIAAERRVPILIHGGRGLPPIADHLHGSSNAIPDAQLIIAHAGIADLVRPRRPLRRHGRRVLRHLGVERRRPARASSASCRPSRSSTRRTIPYGAQPASLLIALRTARAAGLDERADRRDARRATRTRIADGEPPLEPSQPQGARRARSSR